jgi:hypothetical protein
MTALRLIEEGNRNMSGTLSGRVFKGRLFTVYAAAALAVAVSLAVAAPSFAASHHSKKSTETVSHARSYYDVAPLPSDSTAGLPRFRTNPVIVAPGAFGPPDPASCGGFSC